MIVGFSERAKPGDIYVGTYFKTPTEHYHNVTLYVVRESSYEAWKAYRRENGIDHYFIGEEHGFFYEVTTD